MVASWMVCEMSKEGLVAGTVSMVGRRLDCRIFHAVELRFVNRLCPIFRTWWDYGVVWMVGSCQRDSILLAVIWSYRKNRPWYTVVEE